MQYTAENIVGIVFTCGDNSIQWTITRIEGRGVHQISENGSQDVNPLKQSLEFLNSGLWKVVTRKQPLLTYSIF